MIKNYGLRKENPDLPDDYKVIVTFVSGKTKTIECASHRLIDKLYNTIAIENEKTKKKEVVSEFVGINPVPYFEFWTKDNKLETIPITSIESLVYDDSFTKIVELRNSELTEKNNTNIEKEK